MQLEKVHTNDNRVDMLTKVMTRGKLQVCSWLTGMTAGRQTLHDVGRESLLGYPLTWRMKLSPT
jgi:hypothetical protein